MRLRSRGSSQPRGTWGVSLAQGRALARHMKLPPRTTLWVQSLGMVIGGILQICIANRTLETRRGILLGPCAVQRPARGRPSGAAHARTQPDARSESRQTAPPHFPEPQFVRLHMAVTMCRAAPRAFRRAPQNCKRLDYTVSPLPPFVNLKSTRNGRGVEERNLERVPRVQG